MDKPQILNKEVDKTAAVVALRSGEDDVFLITPQGEFKLEKGMYGGWLMRPPKELDAAYGVWCFAKEKGEAGDEVVERVREVKERVARIANLLGVKSQPRVLLTTKWFKVVRAVRVDATEKYAVYDIEPTVEEATATLAYVHYHVWWSRRGKCHGEICGVLDRFSKLLKAEFKDLEVDEAGVYVPYDVSRLASVVAKLVSAAEEGVAEEAGRGGGAASAPAQEADKTAYLIVKLPRDAEEVIKELERVVKQRLKELNIEAEVQIRAEV